MKSTLILAGFVACAGAGFMAAAPASAACSPSFTSIPCTIAENVAAAPGQIATGLVAAPGQFLGTSCPLDGDGNSTAPCGITAAPGQLVGGLSAAPGQFVGAVVGAPAQFATGATQIATAPVAIAGGLLAAPGQFLSAIQNGGTAP
ncbi:MAG: hypothetical protein QOE61_5538 [Micromonosporaceae bacterium]|nr:hypothetical protein [Micromonosporaceae bacterium]